MVTSKYVRHGKIYKLSLSFRYTEYVFTASDEKILYNSGLHMFRKWT
jgi:hypothetical protein